MVNYNETYYVMLVYWCPLIHLRTVKFSILVRKSSAEHFCIQEKNCDHKISFYVSKCVFIKYF